MASLVGKQLSEVYQQLLLKDPNNQFMFDGAGKNLGFIPKYVPPGFTGDSFTSLFTDNTPPAMTDTGSSTLFGFGIGPTALSKNYPQLAAMSYGSDLSFSPQARVILGTVGATTLREQDPVVYQNARTHTVLRKSLSTTGGWLELASMDNANGLNSKRHMAFFTPYGDSGTHFTELGCTGGATVRLEGASLFYPTGATGTINNGAASNKWKEFFCVNGAINTSDGRHKTAPKPIDDKCLDAWADVEIIAYQWLESVKNKQDNARVHFGVIAQQVRDVFLSHGLDGTEYGLLCYDSWEEQTEPVYEQIERVVQEVNNVGEIVNVVVTEQVDTGKRVIVREKGDVWGIRPDQCQWLESALQRRTNKQLIAEIKLIKEQITALNAPAKT